MKDMKKKSNIEKILLIAGGIVFLFLLWWLLSYLFRIGGNYNLPDPFASISAACTALFGEAASKTWISIGWSIARLLLGFVISFSLALLLGTLGGLYPRFKTFLSPFITVIKAIPTIAIVVLLSSLLFGPGYRDKAPFIPVYLVFFVIFPIQYEALLSGFTSLDKEVVDAMKLDKAERSFYSLFKIYYPTSTPYLLLSFAQSLGLGLKVVLMAEITVGDSVGEGLGELIRENSAPILDMENILGYSLIAIALVLVADLSLHMIKKKLRRHLEGV